LEYATFLATISLMCMIELFDKRGIGLECYWNKGWVMGDFVSISWSQKPCESLV